MLAIDQGLADQFKGGVSASNQLNQDIDIRVPGDVKNIPAERGITRRTIGIITTRTDPADNNIASRTTGNFSGVVLQQFVGTAADGPEAANPNLHCLHPANPSLRNMRFILRIAWRVRCSFSMSPKRT